MASAQAERRVCSVKLSDWQSALTAVFSGSLAAPVSAVEWKPVFFPVFYLSAVRLPLKKLASLWHGERFPLSAVLMPRRCWKLQLMVALRHWLSVALTFVTSMIRLPRERRLIRLISW